MNLTQDKITTFLADPGTSLLRNHEVQEAIQDYLGDGYPLYMNALTRCQESVRTIVSNLNGLVSGTTSIESTDLATVISNTPKKNGEFEFRKKIKFALQKECIDAQIVQLEATTNILRRMNEQIKRKQTVAVQSGSRSINKFASTLATIRHSVHRLYSAISRGNVHTCHDTHEVQLFLKPRSGMFEGTKPRGLKKAPVAFQVAFWLETPTTSGPDTWAYNTEIEVLEREGDLDELEDR
ncbi:hypothetical protein BJY01DRAFT_255714 [Aspergillus pseudoustus]|uniref:Uncharacterized protein n=1 Tax=Aspergillus pseudoustus TaxID=1810923 RepID=A0ABR4II79_9EURO